MNKLIILLLGLFSLSLQAADAPSAKVSISEVENAIPHVEGDASLDDAEKEKLLVSLRRTVSLLKSGDDFRKKTAAFEKLRNTAATEAARLHTELEAETAQAQQSADALEDMTLAELDSQVQQDKADLAVANTTLTEISTLLQFESSRPNDARNTQAELKKTLTDLTAQTQQAPAGASGYTETARIWQLQAETEVANLELKMLAEELLSRPVRLELLKAQQDTGSQRVARLQARIEANQLSALAMRKGEAEQALSKAESAEQEAKGKHPVILELAARNTAMSSHSAELAGMLEKARATELSAREEANRFEDDLKTIERKLEVVGMSRAMGQVLREQQLRLPDRKFRGESTSKREQEISDASLRQFEYEEERRNLRDITKYVAGLTAGLPEEEAADLKADLTELALARKELVANVIDVESNFLRTLGELDFTVRRLLVAADLYSAFISERLLWIRTSAPVSWDTFAAIPAELKRIFAPKQWLELLMLLPAHVFGSVLSLFLLLIFAVLWNSRGRLLLALNATGDRVGNVESDGLRYSFQGLGLTVLLALQRPFLVFAAGVTISGLAGQSIAAEALGRALDVVCYYYFGLEILRYLVHTNGLARRHFHWAVSTLQPLSRRLISLESVFVPSVIIAIIAGDFYRTEGDSVISMVALISAQMALALFFARMPHFMEAKLDHLLASRRGARRSIWGKLVRQFLVLIPCLLVGSMLLGYGATAIKFLVLLLLTITLFAVLLLVHEFGLRWLRLVRARLIKAEREAALAAAAEREEKEKDGGEVFAEALDEPDPDALDDDGRKLLTALLALGAVFGVWAIWADVLPALGILNTIDLWTQAAVVDGKDVRVPVTLADIGVALMVGFVGYVAIQRIPGLLEIMLRQKMGLAAGTVYAVSTLFRYGLITLVVIFVLSLLGGSWSQIQWAVAALSVGIGFGLQEIVANFISGLILLFEQPIRVGDTITVGDTSGVVTRIRMRATTIRDWNRRELLVPNKEFITGRLLNWSLSDEVNRIVVVVGVAYGSNLKKAMDLALEAAREHPEVMQDPGPFITFDEFGDNSLQLVLRFYIDSVDTLLTTSSAVRMAINEKYNAAGIVVSFPQRDVHLDTSAPLDINVRSMDGIVPPAQ